MENYLRNVRTLARCQAAYDNMHPPEYYEDDQTDNEDQDILPNEER
jgi:hypothetical protein